MKTKAQKTADPQFSVEVNTILAGIFTKRRGITFEYSHTAHTATVDMHRKHITLPIFSKTTPIEVADHLLTHECAHVLFTSDTFLDDLDRMIPHPASHKGLVHSIFNVVEDARIEKLMCRQHPNLHKSYKISYEFLLFDACIFTVDDEKITQSNINSQNFLTRLNVHVKCGDLLSINFDQKEMDIVDRVKDANTQYDVYMLTKEIYESMLEENNKSQDETGDDQESNSDSKDGTERAEGQSNGSGDSSESSESSESSDDSSESSESSDGDQGSSGSSQSGDDEKESSDCDGSGSDDSGNDSDSTNQNNSEVSQNSGDISDQENKSSISYDAIVTNSRASSNTHSTLNLSGFEPYVIDTNSHIFSMFGSQLSRTKASDMARKFGSSAASIFMSRMRAREYARIQQSPTGVLNPKKLWSHKTSDDVFLTQDIVRSGKNHGVAIFIDLSSSMAGSLRIENLSMQLLNTIEFCEQAGIPFVVYGHTGTVRGGKSFNEDVALGSTCSCVLVSSNQKKSKIKEFKLCLANISEKSTAGQVSFRLVGSTGIANMMVECMGHVKSFKENQSIEIMHTIVMSDGGDNNHCKCSGGENYYESMLFGPDTNFVSMNGGKERYTISKTLDNRSWNVPAQMFGIYTNSYMTYIRFANVYQDSLKYDILDGNIMKMKDVSGSGYHQEFVFRDSSEYPTTVSRDPSRQRHYKKRNGLFVDIFAASIAEAEK